ncbi:MAG: phosphoenolpyruvate--protein phosphotransferase [Phycisphaerales bacterium]|nr:phosphoenolpyruvate--protein phosphotransferase [Phycisphaerales bacterium]
MQTIKGIPVSNGVVIGRVFLIEDDVSLRVPRRSIQSADAPAEVERFDFARLAAIEELNQLHKTAADEMGREAAKIFLFHIGAFNDPSILNPIRSMISDDLVSAEYASSAVLRKLAEKFAQHPDSTFQSKVDDLRDLASRLIRHLGGQKISTVSSADDQTVVVARDLTPSQTAAFDRSKIRAFVTDLGGKTSHTAIVASALGLPAVVGTRTLSREAREGQVIIVDGSKGVVILDPDDETLDKYLLRVEQVRQAKISLHELAGLPAATADGTEITLLGNIEFPEEIDLVLDDGGKGIGLYRTEFLYLTRTTMPTEEDHYDAYMQCVKRLDGLELTIRTIDLGADKYTQLQAENPERNPALGLRSIRYCLQNLDIFRVQLRAILRASAHGPIKIMFPLVTNISEFRTAKYFVKEEMEELDEKGIAYDRDIKIGMMVEVPAAALMANAFAREVDFFSVGTNDLVQYTLAVDRTNEQVASLYTPIHPAVLKLVRDVSRSAKRHSIPISCCGASAGEPEFAALLIGLGIRTLSVTASGIPLLKQAIRGLTVAHCERIVKKAISYDSESDAAGYVRDRLRKLVPEVFERRPLD